MGVTTPRMMPRPVSFLIQGDLQGGDYVPVRPFEAVNEAVTEFFFKFKNFVKFFRYFTVFFVKVTFQLLSNSLLKMASMHKR